MKNQHPAEMVEAHSRFSVEYEDEEEIDSAIRYGQLDWEWDTSEH
jgi:hypothetical protein